MDRRLFLKTAGATGLGLLAARPASAQHPHVGETCGMGVLIDTTQCIGCRKCEWACNDHNDLPETSLEAFEDKTVFAEMRRPAADRFTVVNKFGTEDAPIWAKVQCMHCHDAACASACIVTAFSRREDGPIIYDEGRCMGCRYCMVACPFQIPAYEWEDPLTPRVRKCTFCFDRLDEGKAPACVTVCPVQCLTFGERGQLLETAHSHIDRHPDRYIDHIYGEHEVGGTAWMYMASVPFSELGLPTLGAAAIPCVTETIQHSVFKNFFPPLALYAFFGQIMWLTRERKPLTTAEIAEYGIDADPPATNDRGGAS